MKMKFCMGRTMGGEDRGVKGERIVHTKNV